MPVRHSLARPLSLLVYVVVSCSCDPVDVALNKPIDANVTCGYASPERFLSHMYATGYYGCPVVGREGDIKRYRDSPVCLSQS